MSARPTMKPFWALAAVTWLATSARSVAAAPSVWVIDDGEKIRRDAIATPFERGERNPVWQPGAPVHVFALKGESIALQVVAEADDAPLDAVTVDLPQLGPAAIERFVEHFVVVRRPSGGRAPGESLGWEQGAGPSARAWVGPVPDALVPVRFAPPWAPYPMRVAPRSNGIVWIDVDVPGDARAGAYRGAISVRDGDRALASLAVVLDVADAALPDATPSALLDYDPGELARRMGAGARDAAEEALWKLLHAHRIAPLHDATRPDDVRRQRAALDGSLYTPAHGYDGPRPGVGDGLLVLGAYGSLGDASAATMATVTAIADAAAQAGLFGKADVVLYADDEDCASPRGAAWRAALRGADDPYDRRVRVAWTCSDDLAGQPVDVAMRLARFDRRDAAHGDAGARGQEAWVYNGVSPRTGTFLIDADAIAPRVNGWLAAIYGVPRWFYWESTFWYDEHGKTPHDPFADPESIHNKDGDWANGDGVLVYPGRQVDAFGEHSLGFDGVVPSIRLKNWRRGLEDAGYLALARARDPKRADAVARWLIPTAFGEAPVGHAASWPARGEAFFEARRALLAIALGEAEPALRGATAAEGSETPRWWTKANGVADAVGLVAAGTIVAIVVAVLRRQKRAR